MKTIVIYWKLKVIKNVNYKTIKIQQKVMIKTTLFIKIQYKIN